jgi:hypothetical protein
VIEEDCGRSVAQPMGCNLPHPDRSARRPQPQVKRAVRKWRAGISRKHKLRGSKGEPSKSHDAPRFKALLNILPLKKRRTQPGRDWHIVEDAPLPFNPQRHNSFSYCLAIGPGELDKLIEPASRLEESVRQMEDEGRAIARLAGFRILEEPPDISFT